MNTKKITIMAFIAILILTQQSALAARFEGGETVNVNNTESDDIYLAGNQVDLNSKVQGDFIGAGQNINISNDIDGDVIAAGANIIINGNITDDVRIAAEYAEINGTIADDLLVAGNRVVIGKDAVIGGDLNVIANEVYLNGVIEGGVKGTVGKISITGTVNKNIEIAVDSAIAFNEEGKVMGNVNYTALKPLEVDKSKVSGEVVYSKIGDDMMYRMSPGDYIQRSIMVILAFTLLGVIFKKIAPVYSNNVGKKISTSIWKNIFFGLAWLIFIPIVSMVLLFTGVGTPFALAMGAIYVLSILLSYPTAATAVGSAIYRIKNPDFWAKVAQLILGLAVLELLWFIPFGGMAIIALVIITMGSMLSSMTTTEPSIKKKS
jgi:hypothetical protein